MQQKYFLFLNHSTLVFHNESFTNKFDQFESYQLNKLNEIKAIAKKFIESESPKQIRVRCDKPMLMADWCFRHLAHPVEAAGCIVINEKNEVLMMKRLGYWDLPKGKIDEDETPEQAATRELEEETGVKVSEVSHLLDVSYHLYSHKNKLMIKKTWWFEAHADSLQTLMPQYEESIEELKWVKITAEWIDSHRSETYPSIVILLENLINK